MYRIEINPKLINISIKLNPMCKLYTLFCTNEMTFLKLKALKNVF